MGSLFINQRAWHHRGAPEVGHVARGCFFYGRHVASLSVVNQSARVQFASRSFIKVFVGRRLAPLPAPGKYCCPSSACFFIHRLRLQSWHRLTTLAASKPVAPNTVWAVGRRRCLTLRSRRAPTAGRTTATCYSCFRPACRWFRLTSNVRQRTWRNTNTSLRNRFTSAPSL